MKIEDQDWDLISAKEMNEMMRRMHKHKHGYMPEYKKKKHKKKEQIIALQKELDKIKETCVELKRENMILRHKVKRLEHEDKMNQPRRKKYPPFWGAPWYCWGSDAWR